MALWRVLTRVIVVGSWRRAMLLSFHCNRKEPSLSWVVRATQPPQPRPFLHFIVTCNARRQALFHGGQSAAKPSSKPTLPTLQHPLPGLHQVLTALLTAAVSTSQDSSRPIRTKENCVSQWKSWELPVCPVPSTCTVTSKWDWNCLGRGFNTYVSIKLLCFTIWFGRRKTSQKICKGKTGLFSCLPFALSFKGSHQSKKVTKLRTFSVWGGRGLNPIP